MPRYTVAQKRAAIEVLQRGKEAGSLEILAEHLAHAVVTAGDGTTRYVVLVRTGAGDQYAFGAYATYGSALKAAKRVPLDGRVMILPMRPVKEISDLLTSTTEKKRKS